MSRVSSVPVPFGYSPAAAHPRTSQHSVFLLCAPVALISPFSLCRHKDSPRSRVRDQIQLEARALPKVCAPSRPCTGPAGSVPPQGAAVPAPPCSGLLFVPAGNIVPAKNMIFVFAASGLEPLPSPGMGP